MTPVRNKGRTLACHALLGALALGGGAALAAQATQMFVKGNADMKAGASGSAASVLQVRKGAAVRVVGQEGKWVKVEVDGRQGYLHANNLQDKAGGGAGGLSAAAGALSGNAGASRTTSAEVVKGVKPGAEAYAQANGYDTEEVDDLIATHKEGVADEHDDFQREGKLGPYKP